MKSMLHMTRMETKLFLREPVAVFFTLIFPLLMLVLFGSIQGDQAIPGAGDMRVADAMIPALIAMVIGIAGLMSVTMSLATYRENGILRRLSTTPVSPLVVMAAQVTVIFLMTGLGTLLLIIAGKLIYDIRIAGNAFDILAGFTLGSLSFFGLGFILAGILPSTRTAQVVALVLLYPMMVLSGAALPRDLLPAAVQKVSAFLPLTYVVNLLSGLWNGDPWGEHLVDVGVLAAVLLVAILVSVKTFRWE